MSAALRILRFQHGHLYDPFTGERVELVADTVYTVLTDNPTGFAPAKPAGKPFDAVRDVLPRAAQEEKLAGKPHWRLLDRGATLHFEVHPPNSGVEYRFAVELLEDLFLTATGANAPVSTGSFAECKCIARPLSSAFPDWVYGASPNDVRKNTFVHYFHNLGNPAGNVYDEMTVPAGTLLPDGFRLPVETSLRKLRDRLAANQNNLFTT